MHIIINNSSMVPIYEQVVDQIKKNIVSGNLKENEALPSVRSLAAELKISALTVKKVYDKLEEEGFVVTVHGKGTYIAPMNLSYAMEIRKKSVEEEFSKSIEKAKALGLTTEEIKEIFDFILEE